MPRKKFLRRTWNRYSKLGRKRKKKQTWKKPRGRDNKMRESERGYPTIVSIGFRTEKKARGLVKGKKAIQVNNIKDLDKVERNQVAIIGKVGKKKKTEIAKLANKKKIEISNLNVKKFLRKISRKKKGVKKTEDKKPESMEKVKTKNQKN